MKNRITRNWIAVGVIWAGAMLLTYLNIQTIQQIRSQQTAVESMRMDDTFLKNNFEKITRVLTQRAALYKPIDSLQIELLSLEDLLKDQAQKKGMSAFRMVSDPTSTRTDRTSLDMHVIGAYQDLVYWLQALENDLSYLQVTQVQMAENREGEGYQIRVTVEFRFHIETREDHET